MDDDRALWDPTTQALPAGEVERRARAGIAEAWARVWELPLPFYRERFEAAGFGPDEVPPLDAVPRTTKPDLRADEATHPPWGRHRAVGLGDAVRIGVSGGTTGRPTTFFYGPTDLDVHVEVVTRNLWRHGLRPGMRFTHSWPQGLYPSALSGGRSYLDVGVLEVAVGPPVSADAAVDHVRLWSVLRPDGFMLTGSQLQLYEEHAGAAGVDLAELIEGSVLAFLEAACQFEGPRDRMEQAYGMRLRNIGGTSDIPGFAVSDCAHHTGLHVAGDHYVVQACDPATGDEVPAGERGTLVVTAFGLDAVAIRYDVEDIVVRHDGPCPCGETGPRYTLLGRSADAVTVGSRMVLPLDVQLALDDLGGPEFAVDGAGEADVLVLAVEHDGPTGALAGAIRERLDVPVEVHPVPRGSLPRSSFKPRRVGSEPIARPSRPGVR